MAAVLGINAVFHDPAAALVVDGEIVAAAEEERFSRRKHGKTPVAFSTWELPEAAARWCLEHANVDASQLDAVAYSYDPALAVPVTANVVEHDWEGLAADSKADIDFRERDQPGVSQIYTYHVDRGKFDNLLLQHALEQLDLGPFAGQCRLRPLDGPLPLLDAFAVGLEGLPLFADGGGLIGLLLPHLFGRVQEPLCLGLVFLQFLLLGGRFLVHSIGYGFHLEPSNKIGANTIKQLRGAFNRCPTTPCCR